MKESHIPVPSREQIVNQQIQSLLSVAGVMAQIVKGDAESHTGGSLDGGAKMAAEQTLIKACNRMDSILDAPSAWETTGYDGLINQLNAIYIAHREVLKLQSESVKALDRPSRRYSPTLVKLAPGQWIAVLGQLTDLDNSIIGIGDSPETALAEFDNSFKGIASKEVLTWAASYADAIEAGTTPPQHPSLSKTQNEASLSLDNRTNQPSPGAPKPRKNIRRNRKSAESDGNGSPGEA